MESDPTQAASPAATEAPAAPPEPAASDEPIGYSRGSFEDTFSKAFSWTEQPTDPEPAVSKGEATTDAEDADEGAKAEGEEPAAPETPAGVTPEATPGEDPQPPEKPPSRREQERLAKEQKIADLRAQLAERDPETIRTRLRDEVRAEIEAEQQRRANEAAQQAAAQQSTADLERFEAAVRMPDNDPRLGELVPGDPDGRTLYQWREDRKDLVSRFPEAERHFRTEASRFVDSKLAELGQQQNAFWIDVRSQMADTATRNGLDPGEWEKPGLTFADIGLAIEQAATARATERVTADLTGKVQAAEAEVLKIRKELQDANDQLLGLTKAPTAAGRSQSTTDERSKGANYRGTWQDNLNAAFG